MQICSIPMQCSLYCVFVELKFQPMFTSDFQSKALERKLTLCCIYIWRQIVETESDLTISSKCLYPFPLLPALCILFGIPYWGDSKGGQSGDTEEMMQITDTGKACKPITHLQKLPVLSHPCGFDRWIITLEKS